MTLLVALGGAVGGLLRWGIGQAVPEGPGFAWATFGINVSGAFALALLPVLLAPARATGDAGPSRLGALLGPGLLGGYTTFSTYSETTRALLAAGEPVTAAGYAVATVVATVLAVDLARRWSGRWARRRAGGRG